MQARQPALEPDSSVCVRVLRLIAFNRAAACLSQTCWGYVAQSRWCTDGSSSQGRIVCSLWLRQRVGKRGRNNPVFGVPRRRKRISVKLLQQVRSCTTGLCIAEAIDAITGLRVAQMRKIPGSAPRYAKVARREQRRIYAARVIQRCYGRCAAAAVRCLPTTWSLTLALLHRLPPPCPAARYRLRQKLEAAAKQAARTAARLEYMDKVATRLQRRYIRLRNERYVFSCLASCALLATAAAACTHSGSSLGMTWTQAATMLLAW